MNNPMQNLHDIGLNPFAVTLLAESMLKSVYVKHCGTKPLTFEFPVHRGDCDGWVGVRITIEAVPTAHGVPVPAEIDRDTDGELLIDWSPAKGRMVTLSLRADGRLSYAITWDGEKSHGTAQMPAGVALPADQQEKELGACSISRATIGDKTHDRATENSNRRTGGQEQSGREAGRRDAIRAGSAELGARGDNAAQHEEVNAGPGPSAPPCGNECNGMCQLPEGYRWCAKSGGASGVQEGGK